MNSENQISEAFKSFMTETPEHSKAWAEMVQKLSKASGLDAKTQALTYLAVLAATGGHSGIPFHVNQAMTLGATRDEIISTVLVGLPAVGHQITQALPITIESINNFHSDKKV